MSLTTKLDKSLKQHDQADIIKKFLKFCVAHLTVKQEIRTKYNFGHACPKEEIRE